MAPRTKTVTMRVTLGEFIVLFFQFVFSDARLVPGDMVVRCDPEHCLNGIGAIPDRNMFISGHSP